MCSRSNNLSFQSTPSARRATAQICEHWVVVAISIHALREEGDGCARGLPRAHCISIHALREEGDHQSGDWRFPLVDFNPRPPRGGRPVCQLTEDRVKNDFNPRPPRGGRPKSFIRDSFASQFQSTPSARRATVNVAVKQLQEFISIHALREEGDGFASGFSFSYGLFQSTPSARRATSCFSVSSVSQ